MLPGKPELALTPGLVAVERSQQVPAPDEAAGVDIVGGIEGIHREGRRVRVLLDEKGIVVAAEIAAVARSAVGRVLHVSEVHEGRHQRLLLLLQAEHRADSRRLQVLVPRAAAHDVHIALAMLRAVGMHRANEGELVGTATELRQPVAELQAGDTGRGRAVLAADLARRVRLHVVHVDMAGAALQEHEDHVDALAAAAGRLVRQHFRQREPQGRDRPDRQAPQPEKIPPIGSERGRIQRNHPVKRSVDALILAFWSAPSHAERDADIFS